MIDAAAIAEFAAVHTTSTAAVQALIDSVRAEVGTVQFYIFWTSGGGRAAPRDANRTRTLLAFRTPDAALTFAQRNGLASADERPRLRHLTLLHLCHAMLQEPAITALIVATEDDERLLAVGHIPPGMRLERAELVRRLRKTGESVI